MHISLHALTKSKSQKRLFLKSYKMKKTAGIRAEFIIKHK